MSIWRQRCLGTSAEGTVSVKLTPPRRQKEPLGPCFISALPEELLFEIFSYIPPKIDPRDREEDEGPFPLTLVCRSWRRVYEPMLFGSIYMDRSVDRRIRKLLKILKNRPDLHSHPRTIHLRLSYSNASEATYTAVAEVVELCRVIRAIFLGADFNTWSEPLLRSMMSLPTLEHLHLFDGPSVHLIREFLALPTLKHMEAYRYGIGENSTDPGSPWLTGPIPITQQDLDKLISPDRYYTSSVTSLGLSDPCTTGHVSKYILQIPARLEELSITWLTHSLCRSSYTPYNIDQLLSIHRLSLKRITLGILPGGKSSMPDFSSFPCLEELSMSAYNVIGSQTPPEALKNLAAPSLHYLKLDFSTEDQLSEWPDDFGPDQLSWMTEFALLKISHYPASKLHRVILCFNPDEDPYYCYSTARLWPWEHLEQATKAVAQYGLVLQYGPPRWTKEEWDRVVREKQDEEERKAKYPLIADHLQPVGRNVIMAPPAEGTLVRNDNVSTCHCYKDLVPTRQCRALR